MPTPHFPSRLHAFLWRNWPLVPIERMAAVVGAAPDDLLAMGRRMGLPEPPLITPNQQRRSYVTVIRRNWHLLPLAQLEQLLGWTTEHLQYILREDDFLYIKLGILKPDCAPLTYTHPDEAMRQREGEIARWVGRGISRWPWSGRGSAVSVHRRSLTATRSSARGTGLWWTIAPLLLFLLRALWRCTA